MLKAAKVLLGSGSDIAALIGKEQLVDKVGELRSQRIEEMALHFVDMALTIEISEKEAQNNHSLKGEL